MPEPVRIQFDRTTPAPVEEVWAILADTDRFNRAVDFGFRFTEESRTDGRVARTGTFRLLGMKISWKELPFQYRKPQWFRSRRLFHNGPGAELLCTVRFRPSGEGTAVRYTVEVTPRHALLAPLVSIELKHRTRPRIERVLDGMLVHLGGDAAAPDRPPPPLLSAEQQALKKICAELTAPQFAERLEGFIEKEPLVGQVRMNPIALARRWSVSERENVRDFMEATRRGALTLSWDLLCPLCQAPKEQIAQLDDQERQVHCPSCNIHFDATFPDAVAIGFRPSPQVRAFDAPIQCIGSPERQPHIVAQDVIEPGGELEMALELAAGTYRLRTAPPTQSALITVRRGSPHGAGVVSVGDGTVSPSHLELGPGAVTIMIGSLATAPVDLILERRELPRDVLTAGRFFEFKGARELLPPDALQPGFSVEAQVPAGILAVELPQGNPGAALRLSERLRKTEPRRLCTRETSVLATYPRLPQALAALSALDMLERGAVGWGKVTELTLLGDTMPTGTAVEKVIAAALVAAPGQPAIPAELLDDPEIVADLKTARLRATDEPVAQTPQGAVFGLDGPRSRVA